MGAYDYSLLHYIIDYDATYDSFILINSIQFCLEFGTY